jgi:hypothetical protein
MKGADFLKGHLQRGCCTPETQKDCQFNVKSIRYTDFKSTFLWIYKHEGPKAFSKGIFTRLMINIPSTALSWGTYEAMKALLGANQK